MRSLPAVLIGLLLATTIAQAQSGCGVVAANVKAPASKELYAVVIREVDGSKVAGRSAGEVKLSTGLHRITVQEQIGEDRRGRAKLKDLGITPLPAELKTIDIDVKPDGRYLIAAELVETAADRAQPTDYWTALVWRNLVDSCR